MKQIIVCAIFFSCMAAMELQVIQDRQKQQEREQVSLSSIEDELARSVHAHEMRWVPEMYEASGLSRQMTKPFFIVNALREIKERMENTRFCPALKDYTEEFSEETCNTLLMLFNAVGSTVAFALTLSWGLASLDAEKPRKYPEKVVDTSCFKADVFFNDSRGTDWINWCISQSKMNDKPYNNTQLGGVQVSNLCFAEGDLKCFQEGLRYNKEMYPVLRAQALWDAWGPFLITAPSIVAIQLGIIAGYKIRRYLRNRTCVSVQPLLVGQEIVATEEIV
ncbi:MAG: hypothetical protein AMXMBFR12_01840 [Candidatus Babeliales bacterium]